jgi:toxin ParE1/3/4
MAFPIIVRDRATQDIRRQANYILAMGNRDAAERFLEFAEYAFAQLVITSILLFSHANRHDFL